MALHMSDVVSRCDGVSDQVSHVTEVGSVVGRLGWVLVWHLALTKAQSESLGAIQNVPFISLIT